MANHLKLIVVCAGLVAGLAMAILGWPGRPTEPALSQPACQLVPVGQLSEYPLAAHKELLWLFEAAEKEYVKLMDLGSQLFQYVYMCADPDTKCAVKTDLCPKLCGPEECNQGRACAPINASDTDLCDVPLEPGLTITVRDKINEVMKLVEKSDKELVAIAMRVAIIAGELGIAKDKLAAAKDVLAGFDPAAQQLIDCNQAKNLNWIRRCEPIDCSLASTPEDIAYCVEKRARALVVGASLGFEAQSGFDYYICPK